MRARRIRPMTVPRTRPRLMEMTVSVSVVTAPWPKAGSDRTIRPQSSPTPGCPYHPAAQAEEGGGGRHDRRSATPASFNGFWKRLLVRAEPALVNLVVRAVGLHLREGPVDVPQQVLPVLAHGDAVVLNGEGKEHTSELQSRENLVCRLLLEKKKILKKLVSRSF